MTVAIETFGLTKSYGATLAVTHLDLRVEQGEIFGFLGPNGAGKSTTIRMLLALQRPTSGRAVVMGLDSHRDSVEIHRRVGYLPGELALYPRMTGHQHIEWFRRARGGVAAARLTSLVERFGVVLDRPVHELSKGNRQKVGLVLALMHEPDLLILDEPTSGLDPLMQDEFERLVREVAGAGRTVFLCSHELDEVQRIADRVAIIRSGRLVMTDTVAALRERSPLKVSAWFVAGADPSEFAALQGVSVMACEDGRIDLEVSRGPIGPVLRLIAERDPIDVTVRHADLDELFLDLYRAELPVVEPDAN